MRKWIRCIAPLAVAVTTFLALGVGAAAASTAISEGDVGVLVGTTVPGGGGSADYADGKLTVCDLQEDGNGVYAEYWGAGSIHGTVWDGNGAAAPCNAPTLSITSFKVCEDDWGSDTCFTVVRV